MSETIAYVADESCALRLDGDDKLRDFRSRFHIPKRSDGQELVYFCGNSLGLAPIRVAEIVNQELKDWAELAVDGHFQGRNPWYPYHETLREPGARLIGAL